ncbi:MAG: nickel-dependent lactate racemase, partial [Verrucomicrobiota bacterium]
MKVQLAYGQGHLAVDLPAERTTVIEPAPRPGLPDEHAAVLAALQQPIGCPPLREWLRPGARICILFTDITRATPNDRLIPWLLTHLESEGVRREQITLLNQLGTHRPNTRAELEKMLTPAVVANYRVLNHEPENHAACVALGTTRGGVPAWINRPCVEADLRLVTGFIEPHFFAGFSGGPKMVMPALAGLDTIMRNHGHRNISDPRATWGITDGNPLWEELRDGALMAGRAFNLNVTLNKHHEITGVFAGDLLTSHRTGCAFVRETAMQAVARPFDVVVTTNSGYPLDLNVYQAIKGISAAARVCRDGGAIVAA